VIHVCVVCVCSHPGEWNEMMDDDEPPMASAADYEELRSVDAWLNLLVDLEELEHEHLINLAVSYVPSYTYPPPACRRSLWFAKLENQRGVVSERTVSVRARKLVANLRAYWT